MEGAETMIKTGCGISLIAWYVLYASALILSIEIHLVDFFTLYYFGLSIISNSPVRMMRLISVPGWSAGEIIMLNVK